MATEGWREMTYAEYTPRPAQRITLRQARERFEMEHGHEPVTAVLICGRWIVGPVDEEGK